MDSIIRPNAPIYMSDNFRKWGRQYFELRQRNRIANRKTTFNWYSYNGQPVNQLILPVLQGMTEFHCSFCDLKGLVEGVNEPTIEHFKPSSQFPLLSHFWDNLFLCCYSCQRKNSRYDKQLLKPDRVTYTFDDYFVIDWGTGDIAERYKAPHPNYYSAKVTIQLYGLNKPARSKARLRELKHYQDEANPVLDDFSYRFFIIRA